MLSPREKRQARTRQEILDAALAIIGENGADKLSLRALARRVEYSPAGLYEYFDSKDDIIDAVCEEGDRRLMHYLLQVPQELAPDQYLVELGITYVCFALRNEEHFMLMFAQIPDGPPVSYEDVNEEGAYGVLLKGVQRAIDSGVIQASPDFGRNDIALAVWSLVHGSAVMQLTNLHNLQYDFDTAVRLSMATFLRGLGPRSTHLPGAEAVPPKQC